MVRDKFLVFGSPKIEKEEISEVVDCLKSGWIGTGKKVIAFQEKFKKYKSCEYATALNSCTAALHLAMVVTGITVGDEVILPAMTFAATANAIIHAGATPVFVDCEKNTANIDPLAIESKITKKTKAIIPVHFAGRPCNMNDIMDLAKKYRLKVIEDCAHAIEAEYHGIKTGRFGDIGCFSFYVTKNIITGEGGMIITDNKNYANLIKILSLHGMSKDAWERFGEKGFKHYQVVLPGYKYNMMDLQAAIGLHQLDRVERYWQRRKYIWEKYNDAFAELPVYCPAPTEENTKHSYHLYTLMLDIEHLNITRDQFLDEMTKRNIGVGVHYISLHLQPFYRNKYKLKEMSFPNSKWISERTVSIPLSPKLSDTDVEDVINTVRYILKKKNSDIK